MLQRIRNCFGFDNDNDLSNEVEVDETYVGGKLNAKYVDDVTIKTRTKEIVKYVNDATVYADEWLGYNVLKRIYDHQFIKHGAGQYVNGSVHTHTIEGFWSLLKRCIVGIYHFTSAKHLQKYVDEFVFRYNTRNTSEVSKFNLLLSNTENRLPEGLING